MEQSGISTLFARLSCERSATWTALVLYTEAFTTTAARFRVRIAKLKAAAYHFIGEVQMRAA